MTNEEFIETYRGGHAIQDAEVTAELEAFVQTTNLWDGFFKADGDINMHNVFCSEYLDWIQANKRNNILGIDHFHYATMTNGTSESFQMFMMRHNRRQLLLAAYVRDIVSGSDISS